MLLVLVALVVTARFAVGHCSKVPSVWSEPFVDGVGGWKIYRIPSLVTTASGDILLFVEGRKLSSADHDWNDVLTRRSTDGGRTWGPINIVHSESTPVHHITIGNPSPVVLSSHPGCIVLFFCRNNMQVGSMVSHDNGKTWGPPNYFLDGQSPAFRALLSVPPDKNISHIATGPPTSIQLASGRVVIPTAFCYNGRYEVCSSHAPGDWFAATLFTDNIDALVNDEDGGWSHKHDGPRWRVSNKNEDGNECQVSGTQNGSLLLNQRTGIGHRQLSWSDDNGASWSSPRAVVLGGKAAASCCCSTVFVSSARTKGASSSQAGTLVFSGPDASSRSNMTLYTSKDSGARWERLMRVDAGPGGYSSLTVLNTTHVGLAYEGFLASQPAHGLQYLTVPLT